jgi:hypothetical protein
MIWQDLKGSFVGGKIMYFRRKHSIFNNQHSIFNKYIFSTDVRGYGL